MKTYSYSIFNFEWNKNFNTLYADLNDLYVPGIPFPFPNGRKQFNIYNTRTGEFRRFRFDKETNVYYFFKSEDEIICQIKKGSMKKNKIYLDDVRTPVDNDWVVIRSYDEFKKYLISNAIESIEVISFDHDLGESKNGVVLPSGLDCTKLLVNIAIDRNVLDNFPTVWVHSMNPVGAENIIGYINSFLNFNEKKADCKWHQIPFICED